ncbi:MAG: tetratricopeptide repeat protein [Myxococcales bacterium]|nr:tetratricopeptide repeat protein [Myxococcales bacterium]
MVKRIKKRIPRAEGEPEIDGQDDDEVDEVEAQAAPAEPDYLADRIGEAAQDRFTSVTASGFQWVLDHRGMIVGGALVGVLVLVGINQFNKSKTRGLEERASVFFESAKAQDEARDTAPPMMLGDDSAKPKVLSADERKARLEKARDGYFRTRDEGAGTGLAFLSSLGLAGAQFELSRFDDALKAYDAASASDTLDPLARSLALQGRAATLEAQGQLPLAAEAWKKVEAQDPKSFALLAGVQLGRLLQAQGKGPEAKEHFEKLKASQATALEQMGNSEWKREIDRRLAKLSAGT